MTARTRRPPVKAHEVIATRDGKPGCPAVVWDGPYRMRCARGIAECGLHGRFDTITVPLPHEVARL